MYRYTYVGVVIYLWHGRFGIMTVASLKPTILDFCDFEIAIGNFLAAQMAHPLSTSKQEHFVYTVTGPLLPTRTIVRCLHVIFYYPTPKQMDCVQSLKPYVIYNLALT